MMKVLLSLFVFMFLSTPDISEVRKLYPDAAKSENAAKEFHRKLFKISNENDMTLWAYKGASFTLLAKFTNKIPDKISNLKEGTRYIEAAVLSEPNNIEVRLIRLSVQESVARIVNYRKNKNEDKTFILSHYMDLNGSLKEYVKNFILRSKSFSEVEKKALK